MDTSHSRVAPKFVAGGHDFVKLTLQELVYNVAVVFATNVFGIHFSFYLETIKGRAGRQKVIAACVEEMVSKRSLKAVVVVIAQLDNRQAPNDTYCFLE